MAGDMANRFFRNAGSNRTPDWMRQRAQAARSTNVRRPTTPTRPTTNTQTTTPASWMRSQLPTRPMSGTSTTWQNVLSALGNSFQNAGMGVQNSFANMGIGSYNYPDQRGTQSWNQMVNGPRVNPQAAAAARYAAQANAWRQAQVAQAPRFQRQELLDQYGSMMAPQAYPNYHYMPPGIETEYNSWAINDQGFPYITNTPRPPRPANEPPPPDDYYYGGGGYVDDGGGGGGGSYTPEPPRWYMNMLSWNINRS